MNSPYCIDVIQSVIIGFPFVFGTFPFPQAFVVFSVRVGYSEGRSQVARSEA